MVLDLNAYNQWGAVPTMQRGEKHRMDIDLSQADLMMKMQDLEEKKYDFGEKQQRRGVRDQAAETAMAVAQEKEFQAQEELSSRRELSAIQNLETALATNNAELWDSGVQALGPEAIQALDQVPHGARSAVISMMKQQAIQSLETNRQMTVDQSKAQALGTEARLTQSQKLAADATQGELNRASAEERARLGAGAYGTTSRGGDIAERDPYLAAQMQEDLVRSQIEKNKNAGARSTGDERARHDKAVNTGMENFSRLAVQTYSGKGLPDIGNVEEWQDVPGGAELLAVASSLAARGMNGSDIGTYLSRAYVLLDEDQGFVPMPDMTKVPQKYRLDALALARRARSQDKDIKKVASEYATLLREHFGVAWNF